MPPLACRSAPVALALGLAALSGGLNGQGPADPVAALKGHADAVYAVAVSPDGKLVATASLDKSAKLWDATTGQVLRTYGGPAGHQGQVLSVAFTAKGDQIATGGADNFARIWDVPVGVPSKAYPLTGAGTRVAVTADGKSFAAAGADGTVKVFPQGEEKGAVALKGHAGAVVGLAFAQNGQQVLTAGADGTVRAWAAADGKPVAAFGSGAGPLVGLAAPPTGPTAVTTTADGRLQFWTIPTTPVKPSAAVFAPGGAAGAALDLAAKKSGAVVPAVPTREVALGGKPAHVCLSPDGGRVVVAGPGKEVSLYSTNSGQKDRTVETDGDATAAAVSKDNQRLAVAGGDGSVRVYTLADGKPVGTFAVKARVVDLAFHPTLPVLVGVTSNDTAVAWNVAFTAGQPTPPEFGRELQRYAHPAAVSSVAFLGDGQFLTAAADKQVRRFRVAGDSPAKSFQHPGLVDAVAWDETGTQLATGCHDGILRIWDVAKGQPAKTINAHVVTMPQMRGDPIYCVAWAPGGKQILTGSYDRSLKLWDVAGGTLVKEFKPAAELATADKAAGPVGHRDQVFAAAFSPDGKRFASGSSDRTVKLWDVATGKVVRDFPNPDLKPVVLGEPAVSHPGPVSGVRFTPDGKLLVTAGPAPRYQGYVAAWSAADGKRLFGAERDFGPIHGLAITPDGGRVVVGCGPRNRLEQVADGLILKTPGK